MALQILSSSPCGCNKQNKTFCVVVFYRPFAAAIMLLQATDTVTQALLDLFFCVLPPHS